MLSCFALWLHVTHRWCPVTWLTAVINTMPNYLSMLPWFPYCYTLLYVCFHMIFPPKVPMVHGATLSHCVRSNNICHKCSLRCNSHSQTVFVNLQLCFLKPTPLIGLNPTALTHVDFPLRSVGNRSPWRAVEGALIAWGFKDTSCWPTHSFYDEQQNAYANIYKCSKVALAHFQLLKWYLHKQFSVGLKSKSCRYFDQSKLYQVVYTDVEL